MKTKLEQHDYLNKRMIEEDLTIEMLAEFTDESVSYINSIVNGEIRAGYNIARKLGEVFMEPSRNFYSYPRWELQDALNKYMHYNGINKIRLASRLGFSDSGAVDKHLKGDTKLHRKTVERYAKLLKKSYSEMEEIINA